MPTSQQPQVSSTIHLLPEHLVDQIKAGEVIERPASLIKEILENAIDAGANKIELRIENNGLDLIQCIDNGKGMSFEDLPYAFCRHATSKITLFEDLYRLDTFGFRGEALASISSVSRISCKANSLDGNGGKIEIHGGQTISHLPIVGSEQGCSLTIRDLFYNTPARLKFIKSQTSEKNALKKVIFSFLLANPEMTFSIRWDDKDKIIYPRTTLEEKRKRLEQVIFKKNKENELLYCQGEYENHFFEAWVSTQGSRGNAGKQHFLFANNRYFSDRQIHQNIIKSLEGLWPPGEVGHYIVFLKAPKNLIDVNVHPNKIQIKFFKHALIHGLIHASLKPLLKQGSYQPEHLLEQEENTSQPSITLEQQLAPLSHLNSGNTQNLTQASKVNKEFHFLGKRFLTYYNSDKKKHILVDVGSIFSFYLKSIFQKEIPIKTQDELITPLLIAEVFHLSKEWDKGLAQLLPYGLEFTRINQQTTLLKTIPKSLDLFSPTIILKSLFKSITPGKDFITQIRDIENIMIDCELMNLTTLSFKQLLKNSNQRIIQETHKDLDDQQLLSFLNL